MSEVKSCHYITRCVTKAWERPKDRVLHFYDLKADKIDSAPSKSLFAVEGLNTTETERTLTRRIEDSVGKYIEKCNKAGGVAYDFNQDPRMARALAGLIALQNPRTHAALVPGEPPKYTVDELLSDERALDYLIDCFQRDCVLIAGTIPRGEWMTFPSLGWFPIPVIGEEPAMAMPLNPGLFVALVPRDANIEHFRGMVKAPFQVSTFSKLGGGLENKLVLPASIAEQNEPEKLIELMKFTRREGRRMFNLIGKMAQTAGLRGYEYRDAALG